jgi:hypothetical protein
VGLVTGLAVGAAAALFPAVFHWPLELLGGGAVGAASVALAGHVAGDELLDKGTSGLLVVAAIDLEARVDAAITRAKNALKLVFKPILTRSNKRSTPSAPPRFRENAGRS